MEILCGLPLKRLGGAIGWEENKENGPKDTRVGSVSRGDDDGIILSRNPLSGRNPGISPHRFEIPPPSAFRSCLSMLLETHVGDCSSICRAPAVCPTVSQAHRLAIIIILHHRRYVLDTKSILRCGYNDCLATIMMPATTRALPPKDDRGSGRPPSRWRS